MSIALRVLQGQETGLGASRTAIPEKDGVPWKANGVHQLLEQNVYARLRTRPEMTRRLAAPGTVRTRAGRKRRNGECELDHRLEWRRDAPTSH